LNARGRYQTDAEQEYWTNELDASKRERKNFNDEGIKIIKRYASTRDSGNHRSNAPNQLGCRMQHRGRCGQAACLTYAGCREGREMNIIKHMLTGIDGVTYDPARVMWIVGLVTACSSPGMRSTTPSISTLRTSALLTVDCLLRVLVR